MPFHADRSFIVPADNRGLSAILSVLTGGEADAHRQLPPARATFDKIGKCDV